MTSLINSKLNIASRFLSKNMNLLLYGLVAIAIALRALYVWLTYDTFAAKITADEAAYLGAAEAFSEGNFNPQLTFNGETYPDLVIGPGLPIILALMIYIFGNPVLPFVAYNIVLSALLVLVMYRLGKELFNKNIGIAIAVFTAFFYESIRFSPHIYKECTLFFLLSYIVLLIVNGHKKHKPLFNQLATLFLFSILVHIDERFIVYLPVILLLQFLHPNLQLKRKVLNTAVGLLFFIFTLLPWGLHLYSVHNQVVLLTPRTTVLTSKLWGQDISPEMISGKLSDETIGNKEAYSPWQNLRQRIEEERGIIAVEWSPWKARWKAFVHFWQPMFIQGEFTEWGYRWRIFPMYKNIVNLFMYGIFLPFYAISLILLLRRKYWIAFIIATIPLIHSIIHAYMIWGRDRYRSQITIFVILFSFWAIGILLRKIWKSNKSFLT